MREPDSIYTVQPNPALLFTDEDIEELTTLSMQ